jgi:hypothetical protein
MEPGETERGRFTAYQDNGDSLGNCLKGLQDHLVEHRVLDVLTVVQDERERPGKPRKEAFEVATGKNLDSGKVFRGKKWKRLPAAVCGLLCRYTHIIEKCGNIHIAGVNLVPEAIKPAGVEITGDEGGFSRTAGRIHPHNRR